MDYGSVKSYVYGMALMLFVVYGIYFLRISPPNRLKKVLGCIMVAWSVLQQDAEKYVFGPDAGECEVAL